MEHLITSNIFTGIFNIHSFLKSWFYAMQQFSFNPAPFKNKNK